MKLLISLLSVLAFVAGSAISQDGNDQAETALRLKMAEPALADRRVLGAIFDDRHIIDAAIAVHQRALKLPIEKRYDYLADWVLPGSNHETFRLALEFTSTHPAPPASDADPVDARRLLIGEQSGRSRIQIGGNLVSPAMDLVNVAEKLGRLDELRARIEQAAALNDKQKRCRFALLILVDIAREESSAALNSLDQLFSLVEAGKHVEFSERWPETLALWLAVRHPDTREAARELLHYIFLRQADPSSESA